MGRNAGFAVTGAVMVGLLGGGCGGSENGSSTPSSEPTRAKASHSSTSETTEKTRAQVVGDLRYAFGDVGEGFVVAKDPLERDCVVDGTALSRKIPPKEELLRGVRLLEERGWHFDGELMEMSPAFAAFLNLGEWSVTAGVAPVPNEVKEQAAPNAGMLTVSATGSCKPSS
ncbi:hypothetical protein Sipo8835_12435 [Streptomyces ipomoeae]|jgi:hypothetical protein|nr:hypothetical protein [Streptomyces ipomoeae]MDX2696518.1 hypothetical protein [Streptomyces ipomoeae]MDX2824850.1 hypothetical protein [Streptomyces ipomoeae]MDX2841167.1 hypothetical protein [Streptomyces ipomoeae]MDX2873127.1 hypothetical protein [Streptomyces ipomoeae]TQE35832.1 hypothetical protein Sipo8835_12435 [Streptomyces ipomoeae]